MGSNHFIETNIVIGYTVAWDRHMKTMNNYIKSLDMANPVYTSNRVLAEAEKVVSDRRRLAVQAANQVFRNFEGSSPVNIGHMVDFVWKVLGDQRDSAVDHVIQYIRENKSLYKGLVGSDLENLLRLNVKDIQSDFEEPLKLIDELRRGETEDVRTEVFIPNTSDYSSKYSFFNKIDNILGSSKTDRDILLDAHHLTQTTGPKSLLFVTTDEHHIHANSDDIEAILTCLAIEHPRNFQSST